MKRVLFLVEGLTENRFVGQVLTPHLEGFGVSPNVKIVETKRLPSGHRYKGGIVKYGPVRKQLVNLLNDTGAAAVTTMIDFYGLRNDFPGFDTVPPGRSCYARVRHLEKALSADLLHPRKFMPYLSLHEFEALILSSPAHLDEELGLGEKGEGFGLISRAATSPEHINDGPQTHPSARIQGLAPQYRKALHGPLIANRIGLSTIREKCPHFAQWVTALEALGGDPRPLRGEK